MGRQLRPCDSSPSVTWPRIYCIAASAILMVLAIRTSGGVVLAASSQPCDGCWLRGRRQHLADTLPAREAGVVRAGTAGSGTGGSHTARGMQAQSWQKSSGNDTSVQGDALIKHYSSFEEYALESSARKGLESLPVPVVQPAGEESPLSIPIITIIGVQKGGTTNLRGNLLTHPMVWGVRTEVHFFDRTPPGYPGVGQWEGDGLDKDIGVEAAGKILTEYAKACVIEGNAYSQRHPGTFRTDGVLVDSSPRYAFNPLAPYRIRMARPGAKFVIVLRDPTDRYFSQLRMEMCRIKHNKDFVTKAEVTRMFHPPGGATEYLAEADEGYEPYTALCRGENASSSDLYDCYKLLDVYNPLYRGLYADQLERWFRAFDRSQIMVISSSEMFADFTAVVAKVAEFAGLPKHKFKYDPSHEFKGGGCDTVQRPHGKGNYFDDDGRYEEMLKEEELIRAWYRPHNDRLYKLLDREPMWE